MFLYMSLYEICMLLFYALFLLGKTKAVKSGSEAFIKSNSTLEQWPHLQRLSSPIDLEHQRSYPDFDQSKKPFNASDLLKAAVSDGNEM